MAVFHVANDSVTGTRATGASTASDWSASNLYNSWEDINDAGVAAGDEVILDNGQHTLSESARRIWNSMTGAGHIQFKTRGNNGATIRMAADRALAVWNNAVAAQTYELMDFTFVSLVPFTLTASQPFIQASQLCTDLKLTRCKWNGFNYAGGGGSAAYGALLDQAGASGATLTMEDCELVDNTITEDSGELANLITGRKGGLRIDGLTIRGNVFQNIETMIRPNHVGITSRSTYKNIDISESVINNEGQFEGAVYHNSNGTVASVGRFENCSAYRVTVNELPGFSPANRGLFVADATQFSMHGMKGLNLTWNEQSGSTGGIGGLVTIANDGATGRIRDIRGENITQAFGPLIYVTSGGAALIFDAHALDTTQRTGAIYIGGYSTHIRLHHARVYRARQHANSGSAEGIGLYVHNRNDATVDRDTTLFDVDVRGCIPLVENTGSAVRIRNQHAARTHTVRMRNSIVRNPKTLNEVSVDKAGTGALTVSLINSNILSNGSKIEQVGTPTVNTSGLTDIEVTSAFRSPGGVGRYPGYI